MKSATLSRTSRLKAKKPFRWNPAKTKARRLKTKRNRALWSGAGFPKPFREVDEKYLAWIRQQKCCVTGWPGNGFVPIEPCHVNTVGAGGSDYDAIPMGANLHARQHKIGFLTFAKQERLDYIAIIKALNARYERETGHKINRTKHGN